MIYSDFNKHMWAGSVVNGDTCLDASGEIDYSLTSEILSGHS